MKKILKPLSLLVILGLVACSGQSISRADAMEMLDAITEKQESDELEESNVIRLEFSQDGKETPNEGAVHVEKRGLVLAADFDKKQAYYKFTETEDEESSKEEQWIYLQDSKFYFLSDDGEKKTYFTSSVAPIIDPEVQFKTLIASRLVMVGGLVKSYGPESAKSLLKEMSGEDLDVEITSESYKTKGDGHLAIDVSYVAKPGADEDILSGKSKISYVFNEYLLNSYSQTTEYTTEEAKVNMKIELKMNYKKSGISLPKLGDFNQTTP